MTVLEFITNSKHQLQTLLGNNYIVLSWEYNSFYRPDRVHVKNIVNEKYNFFPIEIDDVREPVKLEFHADYIKEALS